MTTCYGVDIGAAQTVCCADDGEILRNELGGHTTASLVGYPARGERQLGEAAVMAAGANARGTAVTVGRLAMLPFATCYKMVYAFALTGKTALGNQVLDHCVRIACTGPGVFSPAPDMAALDFTTARPTCWPSRAGPLR